MRLNVDAVSWAPTEDDSVVVLDLRSSRYLSLNTAGSVLWQQLADNVTEADLQAALVDRFGVSPDVAEADVRSFVESLRERELLVDS